MTWGHDDYGGDSSAVHEKLNNVKQIQANQCALLPFLSTNPS